MTHQFLVLAALFSGQTQPCSSCCNLPTKPAPASYVWEACDPCSVLLQRCRAKRHLLTQKNACDCEKRPHLFARLHDRLNSWFGHGHGKTCCSCCVEPISSVPITPTPTLPSTAEKASTRKFALFNKTSRPKLLPMLRRNQPAAQEKREVVVVVQPVMKQVSTPEPPRVIENVVVLKHMLPGTVVKKSTVRIAPDLVFTPIASAVATVRYEPKITDQTTPAYLP